MRTFFFVYSLNIALREGAIKIPAIKIKPDSLIIRYSKIILGKRKSYSWAIEPKDVRPPASPSQNFILNEKFHSRTHPITRAGLRPGLGTIQSAC